MKASSTPASAAAATPHHAGAGVRRRGAIRTILGALAAGAAPAVHGSRASAQARPSVTMYDVASGANFQHFFLSGFRELNERLAGTTQKLAPNPRNAAAGSLPRRTRRSPVTVRCPIWVYGVGHRKGVEFETQSEMLVWLREREPAHESVRRAIRVDRRDRCRVRRTGRRRRLELDYEIGDGTIDRRSIRLTSSDGSER